MITIEVPGNPIPWKRTRGRGSQRFTDPVLREYEAHVALCCRAAMLGQETLEGDLGVIMEFRRATAHACDGDNLEKALMDGMEKGAVFANDRQVKSVHRTLVVDRDNSGVTVRVMPLRQFTEGWHWQLPDNEAAWATHERKPAV